MSAPRVAILGATGAVGEQFLRLLERREFPLSELVLLASERSAGRKLAFRGEELEVKAVSAEAFDDVDIALFSAGGSRSKEWAPIASEKGAVVIDNSSAFRMDEKVPLVVPEVNGEAALGHNGIIANPNCSTIQMVMVLHPLRDIAPIRRVVVSTYQSISGAGLQATEALQNQSHMLLHKQEVDTAPFPRPMAFNVVPQIPHSDDAFTDSGYTTEEVKMIKETCKILGDDSIKVTATCVRVPVMRGHSEAVNVEFDRAVSREEIVGALNNMENVVLSGGPDAYHTAAETADTDETYVGRLRQDTSHPNAWEMWIVSDNLLKGAALNAIQIAEYLEKARQNA